MANRHLPLVLLLLPFVVSLGACKDSNGDSSSIFEDESISEIDYSKEKTIVLDGINSTTSLFSTISISKAYGLCDGARFPVTCSVTFPDGTNTTTKRILR